MATLLAGNRDKNKKIMSPKEVSQYLEGIARDLKIDLSKNMMIKK